MVGSPSRSTRRHATGNRARRPVDGGATIATLAYIGTARFWFESFQNCQSEFLAVGALIVLTIWQRERGSPMSKPVAAPHAQTGGE